MRYLVLLFVLLCVGCGVLSTEPSTAHSCVIYAGAVADSVRTQQDSMGAYRCRL